MMYRWADAEHTTVRRENDDGSVSFIPANPGNADFAAIDPEEIEPFEEPPAK